MTLKNITPIFLIILGLYVPIFEANSQIDFSSASNYKYLKGIDASALPSNWTGSGFNDSYWLTGMSPFWYGDGVGGTQLSDMQNSYSTVYFRSKFTASRVDAIQDVTFNVDYDDGFVLWVNGQEVLSRNAPANRQYNSFAPENHESGIAEAIRLDASSLGLVEGENTLAVQGFNISLGSSDFHFEVQMSADTSSIDLVDSVGVSFSHDAGFYDSPFTLTLESPDTSATLIYTLDGSSPQTSSSAIAAGTQTAILVDPNDLSNRGATPAFIVRASIVKEGYGPSKPTTRTYIFLNEVAGQTYPGAPWPNYNVNGQVLDYNMDSRVVTDTRYAGSMDESLKQIPSICINTDIENLFGASQGIYVNAWGHGAEWERECSVELINPDGTEGFSINAGLRMRGGWSRHNNYPKHAFRLFFREEYGASKLRFPLFGDEGASEFDKVDLRCEQNYSWANGDQGANTMVREVFSRDTQRDMGQPYTRSRYYHLYLNGMYWGLFQSQERSEARYASDYFGGSSQDYDVIKVSVENWEYNVEATDGELSTWGKIYNLTKTGFESNENYFFLQGKNAQGFPQPGGEVLVDIDNLIDYMITIFYTGNFDAPTSSYGNNTGANNFYAIFNRDDNSSGFIFLNHDAEHSLHYERHDPGVGLEEDRVNIGTRTDDMRMNVSNFQKFHPQWLHEKLTANAEYRQRFADRVAMHMTGNGALTEANSEARFRRRAEEIDMAVIAESARWGGRSGAAITKDDHWLPEIENIYAKFFPQRSNIVLGQLQQGGLWTSLHRPNVTEGGKPLFEGTYTVNGTRSITIKNPNADGVVYYTIDGRDPRNVGGSINNNAKQADGDLTMDIGTSQVLKARVYKNGQWSPMLQLSFISDVDDFSKLKVTELYYHPEDVIVGTDTTSGKSYEFIEFKNIGKYAVNLSGLVLDSAVYYEFPDGYILPPNNFFVIATKPKYFFERYGRLPSGNCKNFFSNSSEFVLLNDPKGNEILSFTYFDTYPWPESADGDGYSLSALEKSPTGDPNEFQYWMPSSILNGSPFSDDYAYVGVDPIFTEIPEGNYILYPNPTRDVVYIQTDFDEKEAPDITIANLNGEVIVSLDRYNSGLIDFNDYNLQPGMYLVTIRTEQAIQTDKILFIP